MNKIVVNSRKVFSKKLIKNTVGQLFNMRWKDDWEFIIFKMGQNWIYPLIFRHIFLENSDLSVVHAPVCARRERKLQSHEHSIFLMPTKIPRSRTILKNGWGWRTMVFRRTALFTNVTDFHFLFYVHKAKKSRVVWQMSYGYRGNNDRVNSNNLASLPH